MIMICTVFPLKINVVEHTAINIIFDLTGAAIKP